VCVCVCVCVFEICKLETIQDGSIYAQWFILWTVIIDQFDTGIISHANSYQEMECFHQRNPLMKIELVSSLKLKPGCRDYWLTQSTAKNT